MALAQPRHELLEDLETARRLVSPAEAALIDARSTSRAPAVFALIAGLGLVTRGEVCDAFKMTAAGADGVLAKLLAAALIARRPGRAGGFCVTADYGALLGNTVSPIVGACLPSGIDELDAAKADLDRLLASPAA